MKSSKSKNASQIDPVQKLATLGARICGALTGATAGMAIGGPPGAIIGAGAGPLVTTSIETATELISRKWSKLEGEKLGAGYAHALEQINLHLTLGKTPRTDGFFERDVNNRSPASEVFEGVLNQCKNEHEEKKIQFIGYIFANAAFSDCPAEDVNCLLHVCERLTYRQMCLLTLLSGVKNEKRFAHDDQKRLTANATDRQCVAYIDKSAAYAETNFLLIDEFQELTTSPLSLVNDKGYKLTLRGVKCVELLGLHRVPESDLVKVRKTLLTLTSKQIAQDYIDNAHYNQLSYVIGEPDP